MTNFNVIEIKRLIMLSFALIIKINMKKIKQNNILTKIEMISLCKFFLKSCSCSTWLPLKFRRWWFPAHHRDRLVLYYFLFKYFKWKLSKNYDRSTRAGIEILFKIKNQEMFNLVTNSTEIWYVILFLWILWSWIYQL